LRRGPPATRKLEAGNRLAYNNKIGARLTSPLKQNRENMSSNEQEPDGHIPDESIRHRPGNLITRLKQIADYYFAQETARYNVTPVQFGALMVIDANPGIDQIRVANANFIDRTTMSGVISRLHKRKLITRRRHKDDRRAMALEITPSGKSLLAKVEPASARAGARILECFNAQERAMLVELMNRGIAYFDESEVKSKASAAAKQRRKASARRATKK
jgi:DNA-binding MarR family transcriptional regulator